MCERESVCMCVCVCECEGVWVWVCLYGCGFVCVHVLCDFLLDCCPVIANRQAEGNYQQTAEAVKESLADYNTLLCQTLTSPPSGLVH